MVNNYDDNNNTIVIDCNYDHDSAIQKSVSLKERGVPSSCQNLT